MTGDQYKFVYGPETVYARVVSLVEEHHAQNDGAVHLDLGCGFGAIAEPVRDLGLTYVGADLADAGIAELKGRGFEAHEVNLDDTAGLPATLERILAGRPLASISIIDTLEHVLHGPAVLAALGELSRTNGGAALILGVPNVAHRDVAIKLLLGRWDYTETGLLDRTHVVHHTEDLVDRWTRAAGWREVGEADFNLHLSDQHFPPDNVALSDSTELGAFLRSLTQRAHGHSETNQLVRAYLPGAPRGSAWPEPHEGEGPFLSVIMRTQGRRPEAMRDALTCLMGQTNQDFELIVLPHRVSYERQLVVERMIDDLPEGLRSRSRVIAVDTGGRSRPLNVGVEAARGQYIAILDDDDLVLGHWVQTFATMAARKPGRLLRAVAVEQDITEQPATTGASVGHRTVSAVRKNFESTFDLYDHFTENQSPPVSVAFPRSVFRDLGVRFDEALNVLEDWDVLLQTALVAGVAQSPHVTSVYRRWLVGEASHTLHDEREWKATEDAIVYRLDRGLHVFPPGTIARIRAARTGGSEWDPTAHAWVRKLEGDIAELRGALLAAEQDAADLRTSRSWRVMAPVRASGRVLRKLTGGQAAR